MSWCPLAIHSQYSILQSTIPVKGLVKKASSLGMKALALTDSGNLFGAVDFYKACSGAGIQPILGAQLFLSFGPRTQKARSSQWPNYSSLLLLVKNAKGYKNLCRLTTAGYLEGFYYVPRIDKQLLFEHAEGLICISGAPGSYHGYFAAHRPTQELEQECREFAQVFGEDLFLQLQRMQMSPQQLQEDRFYDESWLLQKYHDFEQTSQRVEGQLLELSNRLALPLVATHEAFYLEREQWRAHEVLLNIQSGEPCEIWQRDSAGNPVARAKNPKRDTLPSHEYYLKSTEQMAQLFSDLPGALEATHLIASRCEFHIDFKTKHYPSFIPPGAQAVADQPELLNRAVSEYIHESCRAAIEQRYTPAKLEAIARVYPDRDPLQVVHERLAMELEIIVGKGLADYLLIVADFIQWAKQQGIPVGPGRGSGAGSIACYLLGITDIEPLRFHLFFERFINPERISYPDIDVDICMDRRSEVIDYMLRKYGRDNVAQIITFGTMKAKMSLKDVGRVLSVPLSKVNHLCKVLPDDLNLTLEEALADPEIERLSAQDEETRTLFAMAQTLEGCIRNTGIHAAGLIICGEPLVEHIPLCSSKDAQMPVTQYSMKPVESVGMLKIDFLGLKTLTSIQKCVEAIERGDQIKLNWFELPLDDRATFELLNKGKTMGVFQLESGGMQDLARQLHLDRFEEIIAVVSLYRPGPMDMIPSFINRKHKLEPIEYDHPWLADILAETYGIMVYQEQVMQIASRLAGFTLAEGDVLRRAMGKKDAEEMARQRVKFLEGARLKQVDPEVASSIFDKMEKFASYGFNKSHAAAYGYIAYVTAFLKANYPREWMAALMTCDRHDLSKVSKFIAESRAMGIPILPPDVNESSDEFRATQSGIRFALSAIKGVGSGVVEQIEQGRRKGPYLGLEEFLKRLDVKRIGKKSIELLIDAGAFDFTGWSRDSLQEALESLYIEASREQQDAQAGILTLFTLLEPQQQPQQAPQVAKPRTQLELLLKEKELLGFFLTGNPMDAYQQALKMLCCVPLSKASEMQADGVLRTAFVVDEVAIKVSQKSQKRFAILTISDGQERFELPIWSDMYERSSSLLQENRLLAAVVSVEVQDTPRLSCRWLADLTQITPAEGKACDEAYDRAKSQMAAPRRAPSNEVKKVTSHESQVCLVLHADQLKLSHILKLKELVEEYPGKDPLQLCFWASEQQRHLVTACRVQWVEALEKRLKELMPLREVRVLSAKG